MSGVEKVQLDGNSEGKIITIYQQDIVPCALDLLTDIVKFTTVTLVAKGQAIPTAVAVANIVTENMMKGNSKIVNIIVDSEEEKDRPLVSLIRITLAKTN
ncbi:MAG TPA: DNA-binding protein [Candidatus Nitrosotalea sp.]|nr:DNA-binding protein [Candidatus Nitrosotalea sp.]